VKWTATRADLRFRLRNFDSCGAVRWSLCHKTTISRSLPTTSSPLGTRSDGRPVDSVGLDNKNPPARCSPAGQRRRVTPPWWRGFLFRKIVSHVTNGGLGFCYFEVCLESFSHAYSGNKLEFAPGFKHHFRKISATSKTRRRIRKFVILLRLYPCQFVWVTCSGRWPITYTVHGKARSLFGDYHAFFLLGFSL